MRIAEFYPEKQGRPKTDLTLDMETARPSIPPGYVSGVMVEASYSTITKTQSYTASTRTLILVNALNGEVTITLPGASTNTGKFYIVKKVDASNHQVVVQGDATTETIDGEESITMNLQYQYVTVVCDGSNWHIIGGEYVKLEDLLKEKLDAVDDTLNKILIQAKQGTLHLASLSQEDISEEDAHE